METSMPATPDLPAPRADSAPLQPVAAAQRIEALDVVRGFALLGIFLMNIEFFNRSFASIGQGMPRGLVGADWLASWFVAYFVQGKFWTIFSLLFGMGFAVMMVRAEQAGRPFVAVYLRRVLALAVFGAVHYIFIWEGDILFTYAVAALMLMVALHARAKPLLITIVVVAGLGAIPDMDGFFLVAAGLALAGLLGLHLRHEKRWRVRGLALPPFSAITMLIGIGMGIAALVFWLLPDGPTEPRLPLSVFGPLIFVAGWLSWKYYEPARLRSLRLGVSLYFFAAIAMTLGGLVQHFAPDPDALPAGAAASAPASASALASAGAPARLAGTAMPAASTASAAASAVITKDGKAADKPKKTKEERAAERRAEREKRLAEGREEHAKEVRIYTQGSYADAVELRARRFAGKAAGDFAGAMLFMGIFMLGMWFVRSGVMDHTGAHLPLFRKLAFWGLLCGIGLGLAGSLITMSHTPGERHDGWGIARGLLFLGNLPACLGYVGLIVLMLHSKSAALSRVRVLAPLGRMALTNYLLQSLLCTVYFYGYALGHWGMPRAQQLVFVAIVYSLQVAFSHWWLSKFRYGPMEWFWRGFTYRQQPAFRL